MDRSKPNLVSLDEFRFVKEFAPVLAELDEEHLAELLAMDYDAFLDKLKNEGLPAATLDAIDRPLRCAFIFGAFRAGWLREKAGQVDWEEVSRHLAERLLGG